MLLFLVIHNPSTNAVTVTVTHTMRPIDCPATNTIANETMPASTTPSVVTAW
jgi:hypothetical protein